MTVAGIQNRTRPITACGRAQSARRAAAETCDGTSSCKKNWKPGKTQRHSITEPIARGFDLVLDCGVLALEIHRFLIGGKCVTKATE